MKIKSCLTLVIILAMSGKGYSQNAITLQECYERAYSESAIASEKEIYGSISGLREKNISKSWLPSIDAGASFLYNSEVVDLSSALASAPIPGLANAIKPMPHEQYRVTIEMNQVIYDGGAARNARYAEKADLVVNRQQTESDLYRIRGQINSCYFTILLIDRQSEILKNYAGLVEKRLHSMSSARENGVITGADIDVMTSEKIRIEQQIAELRLKRSSLSAVLAGLTGTEITPETRLFLPETGDIQSDELSRPELKVFDYRKEQLDAMIKVLQTRRMPKAFGFATLGYGNPPGNNFFRDEFAPYYVVGAGIRWNIYDWNRLKNDKQQIMFQQALIEGRKTDLEESLKRSLEMKKAEIGMLEEALARDAELIALRKRVTASAGSQYDNGTITATDLLNEMNSEKQAEINHEIHKISLAMSKVDYMNISGKEIN